MYIIQLGPTVMACMCVCVKWIHAHASLIVTLVILNVRALFVAMTTVHNYFACIFIEYVFVLFLLYFL